MLRRVLFCSLALQAAVRAATNTGTIAVDLNGTVLSYTDSGAPASSDYITIFAVNGLGFDANVFQKIEPVAVANNFRFVGVNRRGYGGSTLFSEEQVQILTDPSTATDAEQDSLLQTLGVEFLTFLDSFMQEQDIPCISSNKEKGGAVVVGWSFGSTLTLPAISSIGLVEADVRSRLAARIRTLILQEPSTNVVGLATSSMIWSPEQDPLFPASISNDYFTQWVTSYFDHGDLSTRDPAVLQWILPSFNTTPSIFNDKSSWTNVLEPGVLAANLDFAILETLAPQLQQGYLGAVFNATTRSALPQMYVWFFVGTRSPAFALDCMWAVQDNATTLGESSIAFLESTGTNHFIFWDDPSTTIDMYKKMISSSQ